MEDAKGQVNSSAAELYEEFFVPALFEQWPPRVCDAAQLAPGQAVLDVACGTGIVAREALARVGPGGGVTGLDCNPGMLAVARGRAPAIEWRAGVAEDLPFEPASFDAVVSQFGLMFFEDRVAALREMWRVLRPGGALVVAVWGNLDDTPGYASMVALLDRLFGAAVANELRAPYCLGDEPLLRSLFAQAGIDRAEIQSVDGTAKFPSIGDWVHTDVYGWTLADALDDAQYQQLRAEAQRALAQFERPGGGVAFAAPAYLCVAHKH